LTVLFILVNKVKLPKWITISRKPEKRRQYNGQKKEKQMKNNVPQNNMQKTKERATRTPLKTGVNSGAPER
jgi:hypothetical protein